MNAKLPILALLVVAAGACTAVTTFDRAKITDGDGGSNDGGMSVDPDAGGQPDMDGQVSEGGPAEGCPVGTAGPECKPCSPGEFCAGGSQEAVPCPAGQWDHDLNPATACVVQRECAAGEFVSAAGTATTDRSCAPCASGRFSAGKNAERCSGWTTCKVGEYVARAGTRGLDQQCALCAEGTFTDTINSGQCVPYGACAPGTKQTTPGVAGPCSACKPGEYCAGADALPEACPAGTWDHDASPASRCVDWTECGPGMYVSTSGTTMIDRVCSDCASGYFSAEASATACQPWSDCAAGTFVSASGTAAHDRSCSPCPAGRFSNAPNVTACTPYQTCGAGVYVSGPGSADTDRACTACSAGRFNAANNAASCAAWRVCQPGTFVSAVGTDRADQVCTPCPSGNYSGAPNSGSCVPIGTCEPGTRQVAPGNASTPASCTPCSAGQYCAGQDIAPVACGNGTWDHDKNPASPCVPWTICSAGMYVSTPGSATVDRACTPCGPGTFSVTSNAMICANWQTCAAGKYVSAQGTSTSDRACLDCSSGTFTASANQAACTPHRVCVAGQRVTDPPASAMRDRTCATCASGSYSTTSNAPACTPWQSCAPGTYVLAQGTTSADRQCQGCPDGKFSTVENAPECRDANACKPGQQQTAPGTPTMPPTCVDCAAGWYCPGGPIPGAACPQPGTWDGDMNPATPCVPWSNCSQGQRVAPSAPGSATSDRQCESCVNGYSTTANAAACTPYTACMQGMEYLKTPGNSTTDNECQPYTTCSAGYRVVTPGTPTSDRACDICMAGSASPGPNSPSCTDCPLGSIAASTGASACTPCTGSSFSPIVGGTTCLPLTPCNPNNQTLVTPGDATQNNVCHCNEGFRVETPGTAATQPICTGCDPGTFTSTHNLSMTCTPHRICLAGVEYEASAGTAKSDRVCKAYKDCAPGSYILSQPLDNDRTCQPCAAGSYSATPNLTACVACTSGYAALAGATACTPWTVDCQVGDYVATDRSAITDRLCLPCAPGTSTSAINQPIEECKPVM